MKRVNINSFDHPGERWVNRHCWQWLDYTIAAVSMSGVRGLFYDVRCIAPGADMPLGTFRAIADAKDAARTHAAQGRGRHG